MNEEPSEVAELVLEYLASKGFASAEAALREQLESEPSAAYLSPARAAARNLCANCLCHDV